MIFFMHLIGCRIIGTQDLVLDMMVLGRNIIDVRWMVIQEMRLGVLVSCWFVAEIYLYYGLRYLIIIFCLLPCDIHIISNRVLQQCRPSSCPASTRICDLQAHNNFKDTEFLMSKPHNYSIKPSRRSPPPLLR